MLLQRKRNNIRIDQPLQDYPQEQSQRRSKERNSVERNKGIDGKQKKVMHINKQEQYRLKSSDLSETVKKESREHFQTSTQQDFGSQMYRQRKSIEAETNQKQAQNSQNDQIQSEYNYVQLSQQLSKALMKIQSKGKGKGQTFLDRVEYFQKKKQKWLNQVKQQRQLQQSKLSVKASLTNANSQKMLQQYQPIQSRYEKIVQQKKKKIEKYQQDKSLKQKQEEQKYLRQQKNIANLRTKEQFFSSVYSWKEKKEEKIIKLMQQQKKSQMQGVTFKPAINNKSKLMVKRQGKVPIYQQEVKPKRVDVDQQCTFQPDLTKSKK